MAPRNMENRFGEWLRENRESRGLSMRDLGKQVDLSHVQISNIESGGSTKRETIERICVVFAGEDAEEDEVRRLVREGLRAFIGEDLEDEDSDLPNDEMALLERYRGLDPVGKGKVHTILDLIGPSEEVTSDMSDEELEGGGKVNAMNRIRSQGKKPI